MSCVEFFLKKIKESIKFPILGNIFILIQYNEVLTSLFYGKAKLLTLISC